MAVDVSRDMVVAYWNFLQRLAKWSIILALILLPLAVVGSLLDFSWMSGLYLAVIGLLMAIWLVAAFPLVMLVRYAYEEIKSIKKTAQLIGGILFWILLLAIYFYLVPVWNYPAAIPLVFIICAILALGFMRFGIGINPKLAIGVIVIILFLVTVSFYMPTSRSAANTLVGWLDAQVAGFITSPLHPPPEVPKRIAYDLTSIEKIQFFDVLTSEPGIWYYKLEDGGFELFDGPGYHPQYKEKLQPITSDIVSQIKTKLVADAGRVGRVPNRIDYDQISIEKIIFFDPVTADPRVWYYKTDDGKFDLFDGPGYHPQYKVKLEPISPDVVNQVLKQLKEDAKRMAEQQAKRKELEQTDKQKQGTDIVKAKIVPKIIAQDDFETGKLEGGTGWIEPHWGGEGYAGVKPSNEAKQGAYVGIIWGTNKGSYIMRSVNLSSSGKPRLQFRAKPARLQISALSSDEVDHAVVQVSQDKEKWNPVKTWVAKSYIGDRVPWEFVDIDISSYAGLSQIWIKFSVFYKSFQFLGDYPMLYVDDVKIVDDIDTGKIVRGYLGITYSELTPDLAASLGLDEDTKGVVINEVIEGSPAEKGGLKRYDVIVEFEGQPVEKGTELLNRVSNLEPGSKVHIVLLRNGKRVEIPSTIGTRGEVQPQKTLEQKGEKAKGKSIPYVDY